jgi:hypothetical protein
MGATTVRVPASHRALALYRRPAPRPRAGLMPALPRRTSASAQPRAGGCRCPHDRFRPPDGSLRAIELATRRSPRPGAPGAVPDDRDCPRDAHGRRRSRGCFCPTAVARDSSIGVVIVAGSIHERRPCRRRGCGGARGITIARVPCSVPLARALPAAQGACWLGRSAANTRSATCPAAGVASLSRVARCGSGRLGSRRTGGLLACSSAASLAQRGRLRRS